jgi:hypothetical protein
MQPCRVSLPSLATRKKFPFHVRSAKTLKVNRAKLFSKTVHDIRDSNRSWMCLAGASIRQYRLFPQESVQLFNRPRILNMFLLAATLAISVQISVTATGLYPHAAK